MAHISGENEKKNRREEKKIDDWRRSLIQFQSS
jgi:hypothetical protein